MELSFEQSVFPQCKRDGQREVSLEMKLTKLREVCPILSKTNVIILDKSLINSVVTNYYYVRKIIIDHLGRSEGFEGFGQWYENISIETRPGSVYEFKKSITPDPDSDYEEGQDGASYYCVYDRDDEFPGDEYFSIVDAHNICEFIKKSGKMSEGIDPLVESKSHRTRVYVHSLTTIPPLGFRDLVTTSATVYLVINEEVVDSIIEKSDLRTQN